MENTSIEIHPIDQLSILCDYLIANCWEFEIHDSNDSEYEHLAEYSKCVAILNPYYEQNVLIYFEDEFTLSYTSYHCHYLPYLNEFEEMMRLLKGLLTNEICSAAIYCGEPKKWLGSTCVSKAESRMPSIEKTFHFILTIPEFKRKLETSGGEARYCFWNPIDNKVVKIEKDGLTHY